MSSRYQDHDPLTAALESWDAENALRARKIRRGFLLVIMLLCLAVALLLLCSCTVNPIITKDKVSLGGTIMTKSKGYYARYDGPLGKLETGNAENDETVIPGKVMNFYGIQAATRGAVDMLKTKEGTTRVLAREDTKRIGLKTSAEVEKLRITTPLPEAVSPEVITPP